VAHRALRGAIPSQVALLITFGSGLRKLEDLQELDESEAIGLSAALYLGAAALWVATGTLYGLGLPGAALLCLAAGTLAFLAAVPRVGTGVADQRLKERLAGLRTHLHWLDYYASADLVPNGPLFDESDFVSEEIHNRGSLLWDHTGYWSNTDGFVALVATEIG